MNRQNFLDTILPGNYFITKSMELTKSSSAGTLWYIKKFVVLYYYIFLHGNISTLSTKREISNIFDSYVKSLPEALQDDATAFFFSSHATADLRSNDFKLFNTFADPINFNNEADRTDYYERAKKYYFAFLMESGGQSGVKAYIKDRIYEPEFKFSNLNTIIGEYGDRHKPAGYDRDAYICSMRSDYMAFLRNERQILFYYGFFHSKSSGSSDSEFSSLTPVGELAVHSNFCELLAVWEHQKVKMVSQPVNIDINNIENIPGVDPSHFKINHDPYLSILRALNDNGEFTKEVYQYIISRLSDYPDDGIAVDTNFIRDIRQKLTVFGRNADTASEDFNKELLKYLLGLRSDLVKDHGANPLGVCRVPQGGVITTDRQKLMRIIVVYSQLCRYKQWRYGDLIDRCAGETARQYMLKATGQEYTIDRKIKVDWDLYNIRVDTLMLVRICALIVELQDGGDMFGHALVSDYADKLLDRFPAIMKRIGLDSRSRLKNELIKIFDAIDTDNFDAYINANADNYGHQPEAAYHDEPLADLENKIRAISRSATICINGVRKRNTTIIGLLKAYNKQRYAGADNEAMKCECCTQTTFITESGETYLEYHHLIPFSIADGPDHSANIVALCPMCHRKIHNGKLSDKRTLYDSFATNSYSRESLESRLSQLHRDGKLTSYHLEYLNADNAIDDDAYNRILAIV